MRCRSCCTGLRKAAEPLLPRVMSGYHIPAQRVGHRRALALLCGICLGDGSHYPTNQQGYAVKQHPALEELYSYPNENHRDAEPD